MPTPTHTYFCSHICVDCSFTGTGGVYPYAYSKCIVFYAPLLFTHTCTQAYKIILDTLHVNTNSNIPTQRMKR